METFKDRKYAGTMYVGTGSPMEVWRVGNKLVVRAAHARRKNRIDRVVAFFKACALWNRVQRKGSQA